MSTTIAPHLVRLLNGLHGSPSEDIERSVTLLCSALEQGHVCLPPDALAENTKAALRTSSVVGAPGEFRPLIIDSAGRLYLQRYWAHESRLAQALKSRASCPAPHNAKLLEQGIAQYIPDADDAQRSAVTTAVTKRFTVITGGPGTGKTYTATVALVLLATQFAAEGAPARIAVAAPTGKAAARIGESLDATLARFPLDEKVRALLPREVTTVHRLLGSRPGSPDFKYNTTNPLPLDLLIVDEGTMVDLPLMARMFDALPESARVILLGDRDQLASVEAGHVLGDICAGLHDDHDGPLRENICELLRNHRFGDDSSIHRLSRAIRAGDSPTVTTLLSSTAADLSSWETGVDFAAQLAPRVLAGFRPFLEAETPQDALAAFSRFRILTATREGERSSQHLNQLTERILGEAGLIHTSNRHYEGRPILVRRNDYNLRLFNGDIGIIRRDPESGSLRAFFASEDGTVRGISPSRLPEHETAYAMTVHKSQGSEFHRVLVILPQNDIPLLSRELIYTAVTRAREHVELWWNRASLDACLNRAVRRFSGLRDLLWLPRSWSIPLNKTPRTG